MELSIPVMNTLGAFGCDSYDISGVVGGGGSNGALHGKTMFNMDDAPSNEFFLEYVARPQTAEIFFEDVLKACVFYGMPILVLRIISQDFCITLRTEVIGGSV